MSGELHKGEVRDPTRPPRHADAPVPHPSSLTPHPSATARSPLHAWHVAHGARLADSDGWQVPQVYSRTEDEIAAARNALALADVSAFAKVSVLGAGLAALTRTLLGDSPADWPRGVGTVPGQRRALACRLTDDHLLLLDAGTGAALGERLAGLPGAEGLVQADATSAYAGFWLIGPHTGEVLRRLTHLDTSPAALPPGSCAETGLAGVHA